MARRAISRIRGIVTGASGGIGEAIARQLVAEGGQILLVARRGERLEAIAASLAGAAGRPRVLCGDITEEAVRRAALEQCRAEFGGLDLLVNNAGVGTLGRFAESTPERLRQVMEVNFFAPVELIRAAVPQLAAGRQPLVVNLGSILALRGIPLASEYCASKFALRGFSQSLRAELAARGIGVLVVNPGSTETEFFDHALVPGRYPWRQPRGMPPDLVARRTVTAIRRGQHEVTIGLAGQCLACAERLVPRLLDRVMERYGRVKSEG